MTNIYLFKIKIKKKLLTCDSYGDWGLGIGDWGLGIGPNPQSPIPNPQVKSFFLILILNKYIFVIE